MEGAFAEDDALVLRNVVARLGVADVRAFGLTWEDCEGLLQQLGYAARVDIRGRIERSLKPTHGCQVK